MWQIILYITPLTVTFGMILCLLVCMCGVKLQQKADAGVGNGSRVFLIFFLGIVLIATLTPTQAIGSGDSTIWLIPGQGILFDHSAMEDMERSMYIRQQVANAAMFLPAAISFRFSFPTVSFPAAVLTAGMLSCAIEFMQWLMRAGRVVDIDDVLVNVAGAFVGILLHALSKRLVLNRKDSVGVRSRHRRGAPR
ncbi:VanZ family protein [Streptomyces sp. NPDC001774]